MVRPRSDRNSQKYRVENESSQWNYVMNRINKRFLIMRMSQTERQNDQDKQ